MGHSINLPTSMILLFVFYNFVGPIRITNLIISKYNRKLFGDYFYSSLLLKGDILILNDRGRMFTTGNAKLINCNYFNFQHVLV